LKFENEQVVFLNWENWQKPDIKMEN
jgi:hypothetical protein